MEPTAAAVVEAERHGADSKVALRNRPEGWTGPIESRAKGGQLPTTTGPEPMMEVLRWLLFFAITLFLIVAGIFFVMGRPLPLPRF
jgi:hypothetical protein